MIKSIIGREILDSRGNPTVEVFLRTEKGEFTASVPSGASTGNYEAVELRDGEERYQGKGVLKAVENINKIIAPALEGADLSKVDDFLLDLDDTEDKSSLGANAILAVSMAAVRAAAVEEDVSLYTYISRLYGGDLSLPRPCFNIINGGSHAGGGVEFQEFMIVPNKSCFSENLRAGSEYYHLLKKRLKEKYGESSTNIGDEGGFVPPIKTVEEVLSLLPDNDIFIDVAAGEFKEEGGYRVGGSLLGEEEMLAFYKQIATSFPIKGIEDPFEEDAISAWEEINKELDLLIIGDDLLATNIKRMEMARNACNAMILKINQIGTIKEAVAAAKLAREYGWKIIVSHRSGETNDDFIADFAVGIGSEYIKSGAPARGERLAKYNRLSLIEKELI